MSKSKSRELIEELLNTVDNVGVSETIEVLKRNQNKIKDNDEIIKDYIIATCCDVFSVSKKTLRIGKASGKKTDCLACCSYLLYSHLEYSQSQIVRELRKDNSVISRYIKRINYLSEKHVPDKKMLSILSQLEDSIKSFKIKLLENNG